MNEIGWLAAFLGGLLALFSPCSALLLPAFFAYSFGATVRLIGRTAVFYAGLCTTLVPLGVAGSFAGRLFYGDRDLLVTVGGWTVIVLGVAQVLGFGFGSRRMQGAAARLRPSSVLSVFALGAVYGFAGFCAGPILGGVLTVAAVSGSSWYGGVLLAVYALGMAAPLFVLAFLWDRFRLGERRWLRGRSVHVGRLEFHTASLVSGLFFVVLGTVFLAFDGTSALPGVLDVNQEYALEQQAARIGSAVSGTAVLLALAAVVAVVATVVLVRTLRTPPERPGPPELPGGVQRPDQ